MLIDRGYIQGDVVSIKLINGDELITRFESETAEDITFNRPLAITLANSGLGMIPWMFLGAKETITLKKAHVFVIMLSKKDAADQYLTGTTGIALR